MDEFVELNVKIENEKEVMEELKKYPELINKNLIDYIKLALMGIQRNAKMIAPVDTGRLKTDIRTDLRIQSNQIKGVIFNDVYYALFVHEGTSRMRARPYFKQAVENGARIELERVLKRDLLKKQRGLI